MPLIVIPDDEPAVVSVSAAYARLNGMDVRAYPSRPSNEAELIERIRDAEFVINVRARTRFTRKVTTSISRPPGNWEFALRILQECLRLQSLRMP
jgi:hypothetical protein